MHTRRSTCGPRRLAIAALGLSLAACPPPAPDSSPAASGARAHAKDEATTCDSALHESSSLSAQYTFDLDCALSALQAAGCDFELDLDGDGAFLHSSTIEDMQNDEIGCMWGTRCSGCDDGDSIASASACDTLADFSYFTEDAWADLQLACPSSDPGSDVGCIVEGVAFNAEEMSCALERFETMTCDECMEQLDSRACEDALNDPDGCMSGTACTGCEDGDSRDDGVDCSEIAAYSYFGASAAEDLLAWVQSEPCETACEPDCDGRSCGDDGCGGSCGSCGEGESCDDSGACVAEGCTIEGVSYSEDEQDCAIWFFENMSCTVCTELLDSRICEDALNDPDGCMSGSTCTGCEDSDSRDDGVDCVEIATYSWFGPSASADLLSYVQTESSCGASDVEVEGVSMTAEEAEAVVALANDAGETTLDVDVGLDSRAAANLVSKRPFDTIQDVAAVAWVGGAALQAMLDYVNGTPTEPEDTGEAEEPEEEEACALVVSSSTNDDATDYSRLLELSTMMDAPWAEVIPLKASGCTNWQDDAAATAIMIEAIWDASFYWSYSSFPSGYVTTTGPTEGGASYPGELALTLVVIDERITDGDWDPAESTESTDLYARREELVEALKLDSVSDPSAYAEIHIYIDMSECSQEAYALIELATGVVLVVHEEAHC